MKVNQEQLQAEVVALGLIEIGAELVEKLGCEPRVLVQAVRILNKDIDRLERKQSNADQDNKPHHGRISNWYRHWVGDEFVIVGQFLDHPHFAGHKAHTSRVVNMINNEIETVNSRYTLINPG